ncbi:hypothetical protein MPH_06804 [Macrophomina phaseolina MS6]|uniref:Uncharacterized protein n=2 Tax=Macrophomina phaseolina TaxID=35725 RepID=K2RMR9_MACPH|nr:hypothetical protein MPH_06804 [Macrophomina phaseolina MS6]
MAQDYDSTRKTFNGTMIAIIVVVVVLVVFGVCSGIAFCCVVARNKERRSRQAREVKIANQKAAERRAREGGYEAAPQQEEGLRPYQYGPTAYNGPAEMDAYQPPMEVESRAKVEMP